MRRRIIFKLDAKKLAIREESPEEFDEENMKYTNIRETINIKLDEIIKSFFGRIYFWRAHTGLSARKATKFPIPRNNPTSKGDSSCNPKKKTRVK